MPKLARFLLLPLLVLTAASCNPAPTSQTPSSTAQTIDSTTPPTQATSAPSGLSNDKYYINKNGTAVHSPARSNDPNVIPVGATARCVDGTYSFSQHKRGTCSHHGGVAEDWGFQDQPGP